MMPVRTNIALTLTLLSAVKRVPEGTPSESQLYGGKCLAETWTIYQRKLGTPFRFGDRSLFFLKLLN